MSVHWGRRAAALLALLSLATEPVWAAAPAPAAGDLPAIKARGELRIGADPTAGEPYFWMAKGNASGFEAELGKAIAKQMGLRASFQPVSWRDLLDAVRGGRIDIALNALEIRQDPEILFSAPYYVASQAILVRNDQQRIYGLRDLAGRRVATTDGSVAAAILGKLKPTPKLRLFADTAAPFRDLSEGKSEAVVLESAMVRSKAKLDPKHFKVAGLPLLPRPYGIAMRRGTPLLDAAVEKALKDLTARRETAKILKAYNLYDSLQAGAPAIPKVAASAAPTPAPRTRRRRRHHRSHPVPQPQST